MNVTDVKVFPVNEERLKAYATITFDDCFVVRDLKIIHGNSGLFVAMPSKKRKDGTFKDTAHPLNNETRGMIESKVLAQYEEEVRRAGGDPNRMAPRRQFDDERTASSGSHDFGRMDDGDDLPMDYQSKV